MFDICFASCHIEIQSILFRRKDTGGKICEGAGRAVGFVEVNEYFAAFFICYEIAACGIGFILAGWVPKANEECAIIFFVDIEFVVFSVELKREIAFNGKFGFFACQVREISLFRAVIGGIGGWDAEILVDVEPGTGGECSSLFALIIPQAHTKPVTTLNDHESDILYCDKTWIFGGIELQDGEVGLLVIYCNFLANVGTQTDRLAVVFDVANGGGGALRQLNFTFWV